MEIHLQPAQVEYGSTEHWLREVKPSHVKPWKVGWQVDARVFTWKIMLLELKFTDNRPVLQQPNEDYNVKPESSIKVGANVRMIDNRHGWTRKVYINVNDVVRVK